MDSGQLMPENETQRDFQGYLFILTLKGKTSEKNNKSANLFVSF